jgi:hypothetical protein
MATSPNTVTTTIPSRCVGHPSTQGTLSASVRNLLTAIGNGFVGARQAVERMNRLIDDAHLDYPDE